MVALESLTTKASWQKSSEPLTATNACEDQQTDPCSYSLLTGLIFRRRRVREWRPQAS